MDTRENGRPKSLFEVYEEQDNRGETTKSSYTFELIRKNIWENRDDIRKQLLSHVWDMAIKTHLLKDLVAGKTCVCFDIDQLDMLIAWKLTEIAESSMKRIRGDYGDAKLYEWVMDAPQKSKSENNFNKVVDLVMNDVKNWHKEDLSSMVSGVRFCRSEGAVMCAKGNVVRMLAVLTYYGHDLEDSIDSVLLKRIPEAGLFKHELRTLKSSSDSLLDGETKDELHIDVVLLVIDVIVLIADALGVSCTINRSEVANVVVSSSVHSIEEFLRIIRAEEEDASKLFIRALITGFNIRSLIADIFHPMDLDYLTMLFIVAEVGAIFWFPELFATRLALVVHDITNVIIGGITVLRAKIEKANLL